MVPEKKFHLQSQKDRPYPLRMVNFILPPCSNGVRQGCREAVYAYMVLHASKYRNELIKMKWIKLSGCSCLDFFTPEFPSGPKHPDCSQLVLISSFIGRKSNWLNCIAIQGILNFSLLRLLWFLTLTCPDISWDIYKANSQFLPASFPPCLHQLACSWVTDCKLVSTHGAGGGKNQPREPFNAWHSLSLGEWKGSSFLQRVGFQEKLYLVFPKVRLCRGQNQLSGPDHLLGPG